MKLPKQPKGAIATTEDVLAGGFIQVPQAVLPRKEFSAHAKLLYGAIAGLCRQHGYCFATNRYLAEQFSVYEPSVSRWIKQLQDAALIETIMVPRANGRERHIYLLKQELTKGDHTPTDNIQMNTILCDTLDTVSQDQGEGHAQTDKMVISKCVEQSYANEEDGHTQTDTHNIYSEKKTEQNLKREHEGASVFVQVRNEPAALLSDNDFSAVSRKEEVQTDQLPAPHVRYEGKPRHLLPLYLQAELRQLRDERQQEEHAKQQRRDMVHKRNEGSPGIASIGTVVKKLSSVK